MRVPTVNHSLEQALAETLALIAVLESVAPADNLPVQLNGLFASLRDPMAAKDPPEEIEDTIWALWSDHPDSRAVTRLEQAVEAISGKDLERAGLILDSLVRDFPHWPEAWNKRATCHYLRQNYLDAVTDIHRTLQLEPRHFGALCGFAQICLRHGDRASALAAFQAALVINPHLYPVHAVVEELTEKLRPKMH